MFVIKSCQKIEYNALFMMIFIPVSNFGDQPLEAKINKNPNIDPLSELKKTETFQFEI